MKPSPCVLQPLLRVLSRCTTEVRARQGHFTELSDATTALGTPLKSTCLEAGGLWPVSSLLWIHRVPQRLFFQDNVMILHRSTATHSLIYRRTRDVADNSATSAHATEALVAPSPDRFGISWVVGPRPSRLGIVIHRIHLAPLCGLQNHLQLVRGQQRAIAGHDRGNKQRQLVSGMVARILLE